ncbi:MAG: hypothetical protein IPG71_00605 [bacterium]|nr:hypothetical protein [bacterium]
MQKLILLMAAALAVFAGCDKFSDEPKTSPQGPEVWFVNVPVDSSVFSFAPYLFWSGHDADGFVIGFEYYDDSTAAGIAAYHAGVAEHAAYMANLPDSLWRFTELAFHQIFLLADSGGALREHVFLIRAVDNSNLRSDYKARTFFRYNQAPLTPGIRYALSTDADYHPEIILADTQLVGDTISTTYPGLRLLWTGEDPDSRIGYLIPLEFSYALVRLPDDTVGFPVYDDSNRVVGYREGWTNWNDDTQIALYGLESGDYTFFVRVRDDGLTTADGIAKAHFTVEKPTFSQRIMIVAENDTPTAVEYNRGGIHPDTLMAFYRGVDGQGGVVREACEIANELAPYAQPPDAEPIASFVYDDIFWYTNRSSAPIPYALISQFDLVWIIDDDSDPARVSSATLYAQVLADYLSVGGSLWITGRRIFNESLKIPPAGDASVFLRDYFNIDSVRSKTPYTGAQDANSIAQAGRADFSGAVASDQQFPDLEIDSAMTGRLRYMGSSVGFPPEIEAFGRGADAESFDFSTTIYNYVSSTSNRELFPSVVEAYDCAVDSGLSDSTLVVLIPREQGQPLLDASTIRNVTRNTTADFILVRNVSTNPLQPKWRIFASTDELMGEWTTSDLLEVTYNYIPLSSEHDLPCGTNFIKYEGEREVEQTPNGFRVRITAVPRFRSSLFTFPLAYMKNNTYDHPLLGERPAMSLLIANQFLFFNQNLDVEFNNERN